MPTDIQAATAKTRSDIKTLATLKDALALRLNELQKELEICEKLDAELRQYQGRLEFAYHIVRGQRNILAHVAEYRFARMNRLTTAEKSVELRQQLAKLIKNMESLDCREFAESALGATSSEFSGLVSQTND